MVKNLLLFFFCLCSTVNFAQVSENITLLGTYDDDNLATHAFGNYHDIWGYVDSEGREYALITSTEYIHIIDVIDPANPTEIERILGGDQVSWRDVKTFGTYAYAVSDNSSEGMLVIDLSDLPNSATLVYRDDVNFTSMHNIFIDEPNARLYCNNPFLVYDLSNTPEEPELIGIGQAAANYCHDLYVRDNIVYASSANSGYYIYDFTDVANVQLLASLITNGYNHSSWVTEDGNYAIFAEEVPTGLPLGIMDLNELDQGEMEVELYFKDPLLAPTFEGSTPHNPFILGDMAYVSYYEDGILVYDLSDPTDPKRVAYYDTHPQNDDIMDPDYGYNGYRGCWGVYPFLPSGNIIASDLANGLFVLKMEASTVNTEDGLMDLMATLAPNPATDQLTIQADLDQPVDLSLKVYDLTGRLLQTQALGWVDQINETLDVSQLPQGMYVLNLEGEGVQWNRKWVKQ